jgi:catechol 2,3-dioxygenase-like lactoylglutathione lyase family enzyme
MITGLAHLCFSVKDLAAAEAFYREKLGFRHAFDFLNDKGAKFGVYLHIGGRSFVELFTGQLAPPAKGQSYQHLCLEVDDIGRTVADLRAKGVEVTDPKLGTDHSWQAWLADPDGNRIELHHYTPESRQAPHLK